MIIKKIIFPTILFNISFSACNKESVAPEITATGEMIDSGSPAADGAVFLSGLIIMKN
jgi:hypothetical protein